MPDPERAQLPTRLAAAAALTIGVLSLVYAVGYLFIAPKAQRGSVPADSFTSYRADPLGLRIADLSLLVSGVLVGLDMTALYLRLRGQGHAQLTWALAVAVVSGLATAAHGLADLLSNEDLAERFVTGSAAERAAVIALHAQPSQVDPRGLATFGLAGLVALTLGLALRPHSSWLGLVGITLGVDLVLLFLANATGLDIAVLIFGGLGSVVLNPIWRFGIGRLLLSSGVAVSR